MCKWYKAEDSPASRSVLTTFDLQFQITNPNANQRARTIATANMASNGIPKHGDISFDGTLLDPLRLDE